MGNKKDSQQLSHSKKYGRTKFLGRLQAGLTSGIDGKNEEYKVLYDKYSELCEKAGLKKYRLLLDLIQEVLIRHGDITERIIEPTSFIKELFPVEKTVKEV